MFLRKKTIIILVLAIIIQIIPFSINAANFTVEYRGFEFDFEQFGTIYVFASGLPDKPYEVTDGKHTVKNINPKFDDMNFRDYTFDGWNLKKKGAKIDRTRVYHVGDVIENITSDIQLIAVWKRKEADIVVSSMHAYLRGGNGDPNIIEGTAPKQSLCRVGDTIKLKKNMFTYDGYKFIGWLDSKGNLYDEGAEYIVESFNAIFTAVWAEDTSAVVKNSVSYSGGTGATGTAPNAFKLYNKNTFTIAENTYKKDGYKFLYWSDGKNNYNPGSTYTVSSDGDIILTAVWEKLPENFTAIITVTQGGATNKTGTTIVKQGEDFEFSVVPDAGYVISAIKVNGKEISHNNGRCRISSVIEDLQISVEFAKQKFQISVSASSGGTITPDGVQEVDKGASVTFDIKPNTGYVVDTVLVDGEEKQLSDGKLILNDIESSHIITISFKIKPIVSTETSRGEIGTDNAGIIIAIVMVVISVIALATMYMINVEKRKAKRRKRRF